MNRRLAVLVLIAAALVVAAVVNVQLSDAEPEKSPAAQTPAPDVGTSDPAPEQPAAARLLPNMRSLGASELQLAGPPERRQLRFAASLANLGPGPLLLDPLPRLGCAVGQIAADQVIYGDTNGDGGFQRGIDRPVERYRAGCMLIHPDPDHDHWHFDAMASYVLTAPAGDVVAARRKVSFCLRDNARLAASTGTAAVPRAHFGECGRRLVQGISPGWVDIYSAQLAGQSLTLPRGVTGPHCLTLSADPRRRIIETDESDNSRTVAISISADNVRRIAPSVCVRE